MTMPGRLLTAVLALAVLLGLAVTVTGAAGCERKPRHRQTHVTPPPPKRVDPPPSKPVDPPKKKHLPHEHAHGDHPHDAHPHHHHPHPHPHLDGPDGHHHPY